MAAGSAACAQGLFADAADLVASAALKGHQLAGGVEAAQAVVMPLAALAVMVLIAKRRGMRD